VRCGDYTDVFTCTANPTNLKFTLKSYRNQTGHWKAEVSKKKKKLQLGLIFILVLNNETHKTGKVFDM
jgi:hypothetical protein